jgi:hypothetical protein
LTGGQQIPEGDSRPDRLSYQTIGIDLSCHVNSTKPP